MEPEITSLPGGIYAAADVAIATFAGLIAVLVCWPILIAARMVKVPLKAWRGPVTLRPPSGEQAR